MRDHGNTLLDSVVLQIWFMVKIELARPEPHILRICVKIRHHTYNTLGNQSAAYRLG